MGTALCNALRVVVSEAVAMGAAHRWLWAMQVHMHAPMHMYTCTQACIHIHMHMRVAMHGQCCVSRNVRRCSHGCSAQVVVSHVCAHACTYAHVHLHTSTHRHAACPCHKQLEERLQTPQLADKHPNLRKGYKHPNLLTNTVTCKKLN